ncbi:hypothetical protein GGR56DRAFT_363708 [Xylariaceae sp. FL0804]|nr:hypothetical protein GGR56DRAFT_363708 [Xylariaceae sp. FL0804]
MAEQQQQMPLLKVSVLHYRDRAHDEETWKKWYIEEHIPRFVPVAHRHGIDRCELYMTPDAMKAQFQTDLDQLKGGGAAGWNMAPYDVATIYWVSDPQKLRDMLNDSDYKDKVVKFEKGWIDQTKVDVQIGTQTTFIEEGKIVNTVTKEYN